MTRKPRISGGSTKSKKKDGSLVSQLSAPLRDFVSDFKTHGKTVLETVRQRNPEKYLELSAKLAALVAAVKPEQDSYASCNSHEEIGMKLLKSVGLEEEQMTADVIASAVEANDVFVAKLEAIRDAAQGMN